MDSPGNIAFEFQKIADELQDNPAFIAQDITLSYRKLAEISDAFAAKLVLSGVDQTSTVALDTRDSISAIATMLATARIGARFVAMSRELAVFGTHLVTHLFKTPDRAGNPAFSYIEIDQTWSPKYFHDAEAVLTDLDYPDPGLPWWILNTSATTGPAKFMELSQKAVYDRSKAVENDFVPLRTRLGLLFPCNSRPFYVRVTAALLNRCIYVDSHNPIFLEQHSVNLICGAPRAAVDWVGHIAQAFGFHKLQVSGAPLLESDARQLLKYFTVVEDVYGSSETNKSFSNILTMDDSSISVVGQHADSEIQIVDEEGKKVPSGAIGMVRVRNSYSVERYLDRPDATASAFQDGWFYPGDLAQWGENGTLLILGRIDQVINIGGIKIDPFLIERSLMSVDGVTLAACFVDTSVEHRQQLIACMVVSDKSSVDEIVHKAREAALKSHGREATPEIILVIEDIPLTTDGVPQRAACRELARTVLRTAQA